jgi:very-short-patch-repair endonuclease
MSFLPLRGGQDDSQESDELTLTQPDDELPIGTSDRHIDDKLQTRLTGKTLQSRLLRQFYDARMFEEEQGVNIHFLAVGFLKWYESDSSTQERNAPLLLVPVRLERQTAGAKFKLEALDEDIVTNLSLQAKLKQEFNVDLPDVPDDEELVPSAYFERVRTAIAGQKRWQVQENDMVLWFFSFAKFLMYRDLDPKTWPEGASVSEKDNVVAVFDGGFRSEPPILDGDDNLDRVLDPANLLHVVDADGSQSVVIEEVRQGRHLVVQGPPGTGKSQTITNMIAAAVKEGKRVLFVAEKMAALEVVKSRMDRVGLGAMCLELHSHKANKKAVLSDIGETLNCRRPRISGIEEQVNELRRVRDELNEHSSALHQCLQPAGLSPYQILGDLVRLQALDLPPTNFEIENALSWTKEQFKRKSDLVENTAVLLQRIGNPQSHAWRGVTAPAILPTDLQRIKQQLSEAQPRLNILIDAGNAIADLLRLPRPISSKELSEIAILSSYLLKAPALDRQAIANDVWDRAPEIQQLVELGITNSEAHAGLPGKFEPHALTSNLTAIRKQLSLRGKSWFRWLNKDYRTAVSSLEDICVDPPPPSLSSRLELLDEVINAQRTSRELEQRSPIGQAAFGTQWQGSESNWSQLKSIVDWINSKPSGVPGNFRQVLAQLADRKECNRLFQIIAGEFKRCLTQLQAVVQSLKLETREAFAVREFQLIPLTALRDRAAMWIQSLETLHEWIAYRQRLLKLPAEGLAQLAKLLHAGQIPAATATDQFAVAYYECLIRECMRLSPSLAEFTGQSHELARKRFRELDTVRIELARKEVALAHYQGLPKSDEFGEMAKIRNELQKKRRHWPIRRLLTEAGHALQAIKPVFMMSPTSIAQFLQPGILEFDLLLIDEASQVRPVEALGAIARCKQVVVVGDDKQMPPTAFFSSFMESPEDVDDDGMNAGDLESILGLCVARNISSRMLSWHYRSRHHSLIAVSNYEFYNNKLYVIPNPEQQMDGLGLRFHYLKDGVFDRGASATNRVEARRVAEAVMEHAKGCPELSLGVGAFSVKQRDAILDELEALRREHPETESFFGSAGDEPFFVKNLENLQGDERDVIFISVGYGPDKDRFFSMAFGPLSTEGGERRLNVLISRARQRCEVFSSITADDIDLNRAKARGAAALKRFLKYAETGWLDAESATEKDHDSGFEEEVAKAIRSLGYEVEAQVGVAGFFIDLGVKDPAKPGRFLLGVECDGATYHSARWARDRDRLRQDVLESRGWIIHRIWSTDWFRQPQEQLRQLLAAVESAKHPRVITQPSSALDDEAEEVADDFDDAFEYSDNDQVFDEGDVAVEYQEAQLTGLRADTSRPLHEAPTIVLAEIAYNIVLVEGPVHRAEVARRIAAFWGAQRTTKKMNDAVDAALYHGLSKRVLQADGDFFRASGQETVTVRSRESVASQTLRLPDMIPPAEIAEALTQVVTRHVGVSREETIVAACRLLGFRSTRAQLKRVILQELDRLIESGNLRVHDDKILEGRKVET